MSEHNPVVIKRDKVWVISCTCRAWGEVEPTYTTRWCAIRAAKKRHKS